MTSSFKHGIEDDRLTTEQLDELIATVSIHKQMEFTPHMKQQWHAIRAGLRELAQLRRAAMREDASGTLKENDQ